MPRLRRRRALHLGTPDRRPGSGSRGHHPGRGGGGAHQSDPQVPAQTPHHGRRCGGIRRSRRTGRQGRTSVVRDHRPLRHRPIRLEDRERRPLLLPPAIHQEMTQSGAHLADPRVRTDRTLRVDDAGSSGSSRFRYSHFDKDRAPRDGWAACRPKTGLKKIASVPSRTDSRLSVRSKH